MIIGFMIQIFKISMVIVLKVTYIKIIIFIKMKNLYIMFKLILNNLYVQYVQKMENKNLLKLNVDIIYVYNALKN